MLHFVILVLNILGAAANTAIFISTGNSLNAGVAVFTGLTAIIYAILIKQ